eukprot:12897631-Alexandrium_andersonii.AAC.1
MTPNTPEEAPGDGPGADVRIFAIPLFFDVCKVSKSRTLEISKFRRFDVSKFRCVDVSRFRDYECSTCLTLKTVDRSH